MRVVTPPSGIFRSFGHLLSSTPPSPCIFAGFFALALLISSTTCLNAGGNRHVHRERRTESHLSHSRHSSATAENWMNPPPAHQRWSVCGGRDGDGSNDVPADISKPHPVILHLNVKRERILHGMQEACIISSSSEPAMGQDYRAPTTGPRPPNIPGIPCGRQVTFGHRLESEQYYPGLRLSKMKYDYSSTLNIASDLPRTYVTAPWNNFTRAPSRKTRSSMGTSLISNCGAQSKRNDILKQLGEYGVTFDHYGKCLHNTDGGPGRYGARWENAKNQLLRGYKFSAAMENSIGTSTYITEKLFGPLMAGSVPIHLGEANVHMFGPDYPHNKSIISVHDFASPKELAWYLMYLDHHDEAYEELLAWKREPLKPRFYKVLYLAGNFIARKMCQILADLRRGLSGPQQPPPEVQGKAVQALSTANQQRPGSVVLKVREYSMYYFLPVEVSTRELSSVSNLHGAVLRAFQSVCPGIGNTSQVVELWDVWTLDPIRTNDDVQRLHKGVHELEVAFTERRVEKAPMAPWCLDSALHFA